MSYIEHSKEILRKNGARYTRQTDSILKVLDSNATPLNAYQIADKTLPKTDVSTVYRVLERLEQLHLVHHVKEANGYSACKEFGCKNTGHCHHLFVCRKCKKVREIHVDDGSFVKNLNSAIKDIKIESHNFEFIGICKKCYS